MNRIFSLKPQRIEPSIHELTESDASNKSPIVACTELDVYRQLQVLFTYFFANNVPQTSIASSADWERTTHLDCRLCKRKLESALTFSGTWVCLTQDPSEHAAAIPWVKLSHNALGTSGNIPTKQLPCYSNTHIMTGGIYDVRCSDGLRCQVIYTKFKAVTREYPDPHIERRLL
jgi:hypothetical protein